MTMTRSMPRLAAALNQQSYEYLQDEWPAVAEALAAEVQAGATADELRRFTMRHTGRAPLAARIEQAAAHLAALRQRETTP